MPFIAEKPDEVKLRFQMLPDNLKAGISATDLAGMQAAVEKAQLESVVSHNPDDPAVGWKDTMKDIIKDTSNIQNGNPAVMSKNRTFNLSKIAQTFPEATPTDSFGAESSPEGLQQEQDYVQSNPIPEQSAGGTNHFQDHAALYQQLISYNSLEDARQKNPDLINAISGSENAQGALDRFFTETNSENRLQLSQLIYENLPQNMKSQEVNTTNPSEGITLNAPYTQGNNQLINYLNTITGSIKEMADKAGRDKREKNANNQKFNLYKIAQHQSVKNTIFWGPGQMRPDPFMMGQPVSDYHIIERNKGFGGDIDGVWDIDWEAVWRGNLMDKFSRPYRDTKTGEWIGGYIQKRFEVDKWIPATNNYQLLPGERRKARLPEYGVTEARLQAMRNKDDGHLGRVFNNTSAPFNWRKAQSQQLIKTALHPLSPLEMQDSEPEGGIATMPPSDAPTDINNDTAELHSPQSELGNTNHGEVAKSLFEEFKQNPKGFDWSQLIGLDPQIKSVFESLMLSHRLLGKAASVGEDVPPVLINNDPNREKKKISQNDRTNQKIKTSWLNEGRPLENFEMKPLTMVGEKPKDPLDNKHFCPHCHGRVSPELTKCPNCHQAINSSNTNTGQLQLHLPEQAKPDSPSPNKNVKLNEVIFDARTKRFIIADSLSVTPDPSFMEKRRWRKRFFPKLKDLPKTNENLDSKEFKPVIDINSLDGNKKVDEISKSCTDLEIDG